MLKSYTSHQFFMEKKDKNAKRKVVSFGLQNLDIGIVFRPKTVRAK